MGASLGVYWDRGTCTIIADLAVELEAMCGRLPVGKGFLDGDAVLVGAAMCPAC